MVIVDGLNERLNLGALQLAGFGHPAGNGRRVALDSRNKGVGKRMCLATSINGLDYHHLGLCSVSAFAHIEDIAEMLNAIPVIDLMAYLLSCITTPSNDGDSSNFEKLHC